MRKNLLPIIFLLLCLLGVGGCDNESIEGISPEDGETFIQQEVNGIAFKFCLLNEKGQPSTIFKEKENFSFYFSVTNNNKEKLYFDPAFAYSKDIKFCNVYNSNNQDIGKPYSLITVLDIGSGAYPFESGETKVFQTQWIDKRNDPWFWEKATFLSLHQKALAKGNYHTGFKYRFWFNGSSSQADIVTDTLNFKINFKIQ